VTCDAKQATRPFKDAWYSPKWASQVFYLLPGEQFGAKAHPPNLIGVDFTYLSKLESLTARRAICTHRIGVQRSPQGLCYHPAVFVVHPQRNVLWDARQPARRNESKFVNRVPAPNDGCFLWGGPFSFIRRHLFFMQDWIPTLSAFARAAAGLVVAITQLAKTWRGRKK
jgi:hypothetical protein